MSNTLIRSLRAPAAIIVLASLLLTPVLYASAAKAEDGARETRQHRPGLLVNIISVTESDDGSGTIEAAFTHVPPKISDAYGLEEGETITITYTQTTKFFKKKEEVAASTFEGNDAFVLGHVNWDELTIEARMVSDRTPRRPALIGEVIEVDEEANIIVAEYWMPRLEEGDVNTILITYSDETVFMEDGEEADESAISPGDKIRVRGLMTDEVDDYFAQIDAEKIHLFDEMEPRPFHKVRPFNGNRAPLEAPAV